MSRGDEWSIVRPNPSNLIEGSNLTPVKARLMRMAALMKFGSLPVAADPGSPSPEESQAVKNKLQQYQEAFSTH